MIYISDLRRSTTKNDVRKMMARYVFGYIDELDFEDYECNGCLLRRYWIRYAAIRMNGRDFFQQLHLQPQQVVFTRVNGRELYWTLSAQPW